MKAITGAAPNTSERHTFERKGLAREATSSGRLPPNATSLVTVESPTGPKGWASLTAPVLPAALDALPQFPRSAVRHTSRFT